MRYVIRLWDFICYLFPGAMLLFGEIKIEQTEIVEILSNFFVSLFEWLHTCVYLLSIHMII
jgi:hypothetical protein